MIEIIGAMLADKNNISTAMLLELNSGDFIHEFDKKALNTIYDLYNEKKEVNFDSVCSVVNDTYRRNREKVDFEKYLNAAIAINTDVNFPNLLSRFKHKAGYLKIHDIARKMIENVNEKKGSSQAILTDSIEMLKSALSVKINDDGYIDEAAEKLLSIVNEGREKGDYIPTGLKELDAKIHGYKMGELYVISAGTGQGKSALITSLSNDLTKRHVPNAIFALEMSKTDVLCRIIANRTSVDSFKLQSGGQYLSPNQKKLARTELAAIQGEDLRVFDPENIDIEELKARITTLANEDVRVIFVDQLLLISKKERDKIEKLTSITRDLRMLAKRLNVCVLLAHQPNKASQKQARESKGEYIPSHLDMRDAPIENDAAVCLIIHRKDFFQGENVNEDDKGVAYINIAKNRFGYVGIVRTGFIAEYARFFNLDE